MTRSSERDLKPHAILDEISRNKKAIKIHKIVERFGLANKEKFLEIGTGSGFIAAYFTKIFREVNTLDVKDQRQTRKNIGFQTIEGTKLPYQDKSFDLVVSNHVIEHVGTEEKQIEHLNEILRVLKKDGILYLAFPNRWRLMEPHYRLPLLSWFPQSISDFYVRISGKGEFYDCRPLSRSKAFELLSRSGFLAKEVTLTAISVYAEVEAKHPLLKFAASLPAWCYFPIKAWISTLIFVCRKGLK